jgi:hypothetical protein
MCFIRSERLFTSAYCSSFYQAERVEVVFGMLIYKDLMRESFKCRLCSANFYNPEELRVHRMVKHKGRMLINGQNQ